MHGHVLDLLEKGADYIFLPSVVNAKAERDNPTKNYNCPWIQTLPFMVRALFKGTEAEKKLLIPILHFKYSGRVLNREFSDFMGENFGVPRSRTVRAVQRAGEAQSGFERALEERGREILESLPERKEAAVVIGRPYNTGDPELNLHLVEKLINLDVLPIPMDFLPLSKERVFEDYGMMYWPNGRNIIAAARIVARDDRLNAVYTGNFRCGPDSFLSHFVREELRGKPYLQIEVDEHSADAGLITRCEAFLDSLRSGKKAGKPAARGIRPGYMRSSMDVSRTMYIPYMCDHAHILAAASRHFGVDAQVLPPVDGKAVELGRRHTSSKECFPLICTTGSFLKKILEPGFEPKKSSFFMPDHNGPCRFGQYNRLQRIIFDHLGYTDVEIISPGNDNSYEDLSHGHGNKFRIYVWKGFIAVDMLRKMLQERRPYEARRGECDRTYDEFLNRVIRSIEQGPEGLPDLLLEAARRFDGLELLDAPRRPVISVTGEIFMRDNPSANGFVARKLEELGAEIMVTPVREWVIYSTYRYMRDSKWARDFRGMLKAKAQEMFQNRIERKLVRLVKDHVDIQRDIHLKEALELCSPYVDKSYDGQPALVLGGSAGQVSTGISGVVNILPFTCMPETFTTSVSPLFRKDFDNIPWLNIAYDGQEDTSTDTKLQAFMHQAVEYAERHGLLEARRCDRRK
jgi:predicted nucleotide-binding protein (sugar kinase/HSP70/actin superfamily)